MRRVFPLFLSLALLSGCGQVPAPAPEAPMTETAVLAAYETAAEVYDWFDLCSLPAAGEQVTAEGGPYDPEADGLPYQAVDFPGLSTYAELETRVRGSFAPEVAEELLAGPGYRDIGGKLHTLGGARGRDLYLLDKTAAAEMVDDAHWTVTLTFWADSYAWEQPNATVGYSQAAVDYERTAEGWRFTSFCPSDGLDPDAETVYTFTYDDTSFTAYPYPDYTDFQLALYLLHADGGYGEGPSDDLMHRFLDRPADILSLWDRLHADWQAVIFDGIGHAAAWLDPEGLSAFSSVLTNVQPETDGQTAALRRVQAAFREGCAWAAEDLNYQLFSLQVDDQVLHLGAQEGDFPWGYDLREVSRETHPPSDGFGRSHTVDCGSVTVHYLEGTNGEAAYLSRIDTDTPGVETFLGVSVGDTEEQMRESYPGAVYWGPLAGDNNWSDDGGAWVFEPGGNAWCKHVAFYMKDGKVNHIEIEDLMDGRLLS